MSDKTKDAIRMLPHPAMRNMRIALQESKKLNELQWFALGLLQGADYSAAFDAETCRGWQAICATPSLKALDVRMALFQEGRSDE